MKSDHGEWTTKGDIKVRFSSARAAATSYEQQRARYHNKDTQAERLMSYTGQVCPVLIPSGHTGETSQDDSFHKVYIASQMFRGKDHVGLHQLFRDNVHEIYDKLVSIDANTPHVPNDYYSALSEAVEAAGEKHYVELDSHHTLYLFEYYKISKVGGANSLYACMRWPGIHIPQAIISLLDTKDLLVDFIDDNGGTEQHYIQFYERNPAGRGVDFDNAPKDKPDFVRYAVELRCQNPITYTRKTPLPPLEDLAAAT